MSNEEQTRLLILGFIAQLPPSEQQRVQECEAKLMAVLGEYGPIGGLALAKLGAEMALGQPPVDCGALEASS